MLLFMGLLFNISQYSHILVYTKHYYLTFFRHTLSNDVYQVFDTFANRSCNYLHTFYVLTALLLTVLSSWVLFAP